MRKRIRWIWPFPVAGLLLWSGQLAAAPGAAGWEEIRKEFIRDFSHPDASVRQRGIDRLVSQADGKEACELLLRVFAEIEQRAGKLERELDAKKAEFERKLAPFSKIDLTRAPSERERKDKIEREYRRVEEELSARFQAEKSIEKVLGGAFVRFKSPEALNFMMDRALRAPRPEDRFALLDALLQSVPGVQEGKKLVPLLVNALKDQSPTVRTLSLEGLKLHKDPSAIGPIAGCLKDPTWQVRAAAAQACALYGARESIEPLIDALAKEEGRLRDDLSLALKKLTGMDFGFRAETWRKWWDDNKATFAGPAVAAGPHTPSASSGGDKTVAVPTFYGVPITSKKVIFVLDTSGSMNDPSDPPPGSPQAGQVTSGKPAKGPGDDPDEGSIAGTKIEVLKYQFRKCVEKLAIDVTFNVVLFNSEVSQWRDKMDRATPANKADVIGFVEGQVAQNMTNTHDALEMALETAGMGLLDKSYEPAVDTIYLMSDGSPYGAGKTTDPNEILKRVREMNRLKKLAIHAIAVGNPSNYNESFMRQLASENGGKFYKR